MNEDYLKIASKILIQRGIIKKLWSVMIHYANPVPPTVWIYYINKDNLLVQFKLLNRDCALTTTEYDGVMNLGNKIPEELIPTLRIVFIIGEIEKFLKFYYKEFRRANLNLIKERTPIFMNRNEVLVKLLAEGEEYYNTVPFATVKYAF